MVYPIRRGNNASERETIVRKDDDEGSHIRVLLSTIQGGWSGFWVRIIVTG